MKHSILLLFLTLTIIFTGSNTLFIYWNEEIQWYVIILFSSIIMAFINTSINLKMKIGILFLAWIASIVFTSFVICYPLILWGGSLTANEVIISTVARTLIIVFIGLTISLVSLLFFSFFKR
ncbi:MAG: hypothetical protein QXP50_00810 [Candidatus Methanomethylicia archaeon]